MSNNASLHEYIAERELLFSDKGDSIRKKLRIRASAPKAIDPKTVSFPVTGPMAVCHVQLVGLDDYSFNVYGMDSLQAINLASNIEELLKRLSSKFDFFWSSGEPYFDEN